MNHAPSMHASASKSPSVVAAATQYWRDLRARGGSRAATAGLIQAVWSFVRNSTPERQRRLYGDFDFDWEYRVNTMSGGVGWRERLLGELHSLYQPTEPAAFHEMMQTLRNITHLDFSDFVFLDLGSGKGRTLMMASDYPFQRIIGVELLPALNQVAQENLACYQNDSQKCFAIESVCADASTFPLPAAPLVLYMFNPFPELPLRRVLGHVVEDLNGNPRPVYVLYHNPVQEHVLAENPHFHKIAQQPQYSIFRVGS
jgi:SAM-dependent methyltransferase